jgi:hypothetical protein
VHLWYPCWSSGSPQVPLLELRFTSGTLDGAQVHLRYHCWSSGSPQVHLLELRFTSGTIVGAQVHLRFSLMQSRSPLCIAISLTAQNATGQRSAHIHISAFETNIRVTKRKARVNPVHYIYGKTSRAAESGEYVLWFLCKRAGLDWQQRY